MDNSKCDEIEYVLWAVDLGVQQVCEEYETENKQEEDFMYNDLCGYVILVEDEIEKIKIHIN